MSDPMLMQESQALKSLESCDKHGFRACVDVPLMSGHKVNDVPCYTKLRIIESSQKRHDEEA